jgi:hypothetical protein
VVLRYPSHLESRQLAPSTINLRLGAVRRLAYEADNCTLEVAAPVVERLPTISSTARTSVAQFVKNPERAR